MAHFDERSGAVYCNTDWGRWWQTMDDVTLEVNVPQCFSAKDVVCIIKPLFLSLKVKGSLIFEGQLYKTIQPDESVWTLEDKVLIRIFLIKNEKTAADCWPSLFSGQCQADSWTLDQMQRKLTLQRYQLENPGMDFSKAEISGNYHTGGPELPS